MVKDSPLGTSAYVAVDVHFAGSKYHLLEHRGGGDAGQEDPEVVEQPSFFDARLPPLGAWVEKWLEDDAEFEALEAARLAVYREARRGDATKAAQTGVAAICAQDLAGPAGARGYGEGLLGRIQSR